MLITRRQFVIMGLCAAASVCSGKVMAQRPSMSPMPSNRMTRWRQALAALEQKSGGRLGVAVHDTGSKQWLSYRARERFPMCSTFKLLLAGKVLQRCDQNRERLGRAVSIASVPLVPHSPVTGKHLSGSMTVGELCAAILTESDNTAANLLLKDMGGPAEVTRFARSLGDRETRLDRMEPELNEARPGDPRDTTTPEAMVRDMESLLLNNVLSTEKRALLTGWLRSNRYGLTRLRAHVPAGWTAADKTGTGETTSNDICIYWPAGHAPVVAAAYLTEYPAGVPRDAILAEIGLMVVAEYSGLRF